MSDKAEDPGDEGSCVDSSVDPEPCSNAPAPDHPAPDHHIGEEAAVSGGQASPSPIIDDVTSRAAAEEDTTVQREEEKTPLTAPTPPSPSSSPTAQTQQPAAEEENPSPTTSNPPAVDEDTEQTAAQSTTADIDDFFLQKTSTTTSAPQDRPAGGEEDSSPATSLLLKSEEPESEIMAEMQVHLQAHAAPQSAAQQLQQQVSASPGGKAVCKYRWGKVVPTSSHRIIFFCSAHPKEPVFLHWSPHAEAYFSEELHVPCGDYTGHVIVEGKTYPVEPFNVRSYTFEVDLFLKDDVIEDEVATSNTQAEELKFQQQLQQSPVDTYRDISPSTLKSTSKMEENEGGDESSIRHNTKYEDLLRQQLQHKDSLDASLESELVVSQKSDPSASGSGSKRLTPVGDIDKEPYQDGYSSLPVGGSTGFDPGQSGRGSGRLSSQNLYSGSASDLRQDYELDRHSVKSGNLGSSHHSIGDAALGDDVGSPKSPSRAGSDFSGSLGSGRPASQRELFENASGSRPGSGGYISLDKRIDDVWGGSGSHASSVRLTPTRETIGDVLGKEALPSATSTARSHSSGSARQTPERDLGLIGPTAQTSARDSISSAVRGSHERLFGSQELLTTSDQRLLPGSRPLSQSGSRPGSSTGIHPGGVTGSLPGSILGSRASSQHGSRAQSLASLTSEQELSQFLDNSNSQSGSEPRRTPLNFDTHPDESAALPPIMRSDRDRPSSLPAYSSQSAAGLESKRTFTPDNQTWSPLASGGLGEAGFQRDMLSRIAPKSSVSSRASSRTVTPVSAAGDREDSAKVRDLEETVATLRKLLSSREQEVHELTAKLRDLKDINQSLKKDLDHARARRTPSGPEEMERQHEQLLQEKEILAAEVVKLRDRLEANRGSGVDSFSSSSATSMQKRIDELEAHIRDLRHSSDSTSQKLLRAEMRVKDLTEENDRLRSSSSLRVQDLQDDRSGLHGDRRLQIEIQQLREDVRTMRDRNYSLQEENLKLKEGREPSRSSDLRSRDMLRDLTGRNPVSSSVRSDDGVHHRPAVDSSLRDSGSLQTTEHGRSKHLPLHDQLASPRRLGSHRQLDRSYGSDNFPSVSSRDPHQRLHDRSFGSDQGAREGGRDTGSYSLSALENGDKEPSSDRLGKYRELVDRGTDLRRTDPGRYDVLRSRPDGEVSEKLRATDTGKYGTLSAEKLRSFDRERESRDSKVTMSAERLRILEEAERNRERRAMASTNSAGRRPVSADNPVSSKDFYRSLRSRFGARQDSSKQAKYSSHEFSLPSSLCTERTTLSDFFPPDDGRRKKSEANLSDDSDSTSILMSYDAKVDPYSGHEREKSSYNERSRPHDTYYDRSYVHEKEQEKHRDREYRDLRVGYKETNGDDSDTATDILLNAEPGRTSSSSPRRRHQRTSIGDDASVSSLSDGDDAQDNRHRRSKSVDGKGKKGSSRYGQTTTLRPSASTEMLGSGSKTVTLSSGFRTVTPQPLATQHNKNAILQQQQREASLSNSFTQGLRPFAPRSPGDVRPNDVVKFSRQGGKLSQGTVKFVGHLPGRSDVYLGVELYKEEGKHDGKFESIRYFKCKPNKGVFVAFNKVVMAWAPN